MKSLLAGVVVLFGSIPVFAQDLSKPLPGVIQSALPAGMPAPSLVSQPTHWNNTCAPATCAAQPSCGPFRTASCGFNRGNACERLKDWLTFRVCEPVHPKFVPVPYQAPLRTYFPYTPPPIGWNGPLDCEPKRSRLIGWTPGASECSGGTCPAPTTGCNLPCGSMERKGYVGRLLSFFRLETCDLAHAPMGCAGGTCVAPNSTGGFQYHYANTRHTMLYPGVPSPTATVNPVLATVPFTKP